MITKRTSKKHIKKTIYLLISLLLLLLIILCPFDYTISPARRFKVIDESGRPIPEAIIKQIWDQYALRLTEEEQLKTIDDGLVLLPRRTIKTRWIDLMIGAAMKIVEYKIHASICSSDSIFTDAFGYESQWFFDGEGLGQTVVLKRQK